MSWRRYEYGWLRNDGEAFLERGAVLSDTGNPAWLVWIRALDSEIVTDGDSAYARSSVDPIRRLSEVAGKTFEHDPWFIHRGDEGWLREAKLAAELHLAARDKRGS